MKTKKQQQITNIRSSSICGTLLDKNPQNIQVSLVFPEITQVSQTNKEQFNGYIQICLIVLDQQNNIIQHQSIEEFDQYLVLQTNDLKQRSVKQVKIHTIQVSKTGKVQEGKFSTLVDSGKNIGKKSETTILQQAIQESQKKYNSHTNNKNNQYPHFMLLDLYKYSKSNTSYPQNIQQDIKLPNNKLMFPQFIQRKYDGLRCGILNNPTEIQNINEISGNNTKITLLSRGHKEFTTLTHIEEDIQRILIYINANNQLLNTIKNLSYNEQFDFSSSVMFDGELYLHGKSLQTINSLIRNSKITPEKQNIQFIIYDLDITSSYHRQQQIKLPFKLRHEILLLLHKIIQELSIASIQIAPTLIVNSDEELQQLFTQFLAQNYEGAVIRSPNSMYCYSLNKKRSTDTLKYKLKLDMEVNILNYSHGTGKDTNCIIFECQTLQTQSLANKETFQVVQNTTYEARKQLFALLEQKPQYLDILKQIPFNIEYSGLSDQGIPQQPRGIYFRTEDLSIPEDLSIVLES